MNQQMLISISAQFPTDLARAARVEAARRNVSRAELIRQAVAAFLRQVEGQPPAGNREQDKGVAK